MVRPVRSTCFYLPFYYDKSTSGRTAEFGNQDEDWLKQ
ncbi:hypothetical protein SAMN06298226_1976 [Nitrosovibrio sp. Nv4]|nr:hypothetical protein SAMN06298226_1976 [Nitrosovibrio sp. Nv4]